MKIMRPALVLVGVVAFGGVALAEGPRTPVEALQRLQGKTQLRKKPTVTGYRLLETWTANQAAGKKIKPPTPLLRTPATPQLLRGQSTWRRPAPTLDSRILTRPAIAKTRPRVTTPIASATRIATATAKARTQGVLGWIDRVFRPLRDFVAGL